MLEMYGKYWSDLQLFDWQVSVKEASLAFIFKSNLFVSAAMTFHWEGDVQLPTLDSDVRSHGILC